MRSIDQFVIFDFFVKFPWVDYSFSFDYFNFCLKVFSFLPEEFFAFLLIFLYSSLWLFVLLFRVLILASFFFLMISAFFVDYWFLCGVLLSPRTVLYVTVFPNSCLIFSILNFSLFQVSHVMFLSCVYVILALILAITRRWSESMLVPLLVCISSMWLTYFWSTRNMVDLV